MAADDTVPVRRETLRVLLQLAEGVLPGVGPTHAGTYPSFELLHQAVREAEAALGREVSD